MVREILGFVEELPKTTQLPHRFNEVMIRHKMPWPNQTNHRGKPLRVRIKCLAQNRLVEINMFDLTLRAKKGGKGGIVHGN